jgi:copper chaperone
MGTTLFIIEGMTCHHCVLHVQKALKALPGVADADVNLEKGEALVTHEGPLDGTAALKAVAAAGYRARRA